MKLWLIIALVIGVTVVADYFIIRLVMSRCWGHLPRDFPPQPPREDAVRRSFQSFRIGRCNYGYCIHVAVDEEHLHLQPARPLRMLGARPASIPWSAIRVTGTTGGGMISAQVGQRAFLGPAWCLELAGPA